MLALGSALLAAIFTVINARFTHHHSEHTISFYEMSGACILTAVILPFSLILDNTGTGFSMIPSAMDWLYLAVLAFACTVYPFTASIELMKRISAFTVNLSVNLEPVYGILLAFLIFGDKERMNTGFYLGTLVILLSVVMYPLIRLWLNRRMLKMKTL
jgi:drug/metabolite transporter (DMT)-like permease